MVGLKQRFPLVSSGGSGSGGFESFPGLLTLADAASPLNTVASGRVNFAYDTSGHGNHWTNAGITGIALSTEDVEYPDVDLDEMVTLKTLSAFDLSANSGARILKCPGVMTGVSAWTVATIYRPKNEDSVDNGKYIYRLKGTSDAGGVQDRKGLGPTFFYNGTSFGTNSNGLNTCFDVSMWRVLIESYTPPAGGLTSRHFIMTNGIVDIIGKNTLGMLESSPTSADYGWPAAANDYVARTDYTDISIGPVNPVSLSNPSINACMTVNRIGFYNRAFSVADAHRLTEYLLNELYSGVAPFIREIHCVGDSIHQETGGIVCANGYYWTDLAAVKKAATAFINNAEGGNSIEVQTARVAATVGRSKRYALHKKTTMNVCVGTNNPSDNAATKWSKVKSLMDVVVASGKFDSVNVGTLLACGTDTSTPDLTRSAAHDSFNQTARTGMQSGGDFYTVNPTITCGILEYAQSIPTAFTVPIAVLDPATANTTYATTVGTTTPADITNAANKHYADGLHPQLIVRPNGTAPVYARLGMYEAIQTKMNTVFGF